MSDLVLRSYNLPSRHPDHGRIDRGALLKDLARVCEGATAVAIQQGRHLEGHEAPDGFDLVRGLDPALPILVNRKLATVIGQLSLQAFPDTEVGPWGAGPSAMKAGIDHFLKLQVGGRRLWVGNAHLVASVTRPADTKAERKAREERRELHRREVDQLVHMARGKSWVVIMGDFNAPPGYPGLVPFAEAGFRDVQPGPSHENGGRIDHAFCLGAKVISSRVLPAGVSDHRPIEVVVRVA